MFELITQSMLFLLESLKNIVGNYGLAIIALTILVRVVLWPVSNAQMKSMKTMQELQPKLKQIQDRHKADPQRLQAEMFKLYKDHQFNPLGGCLPMLVQIPLFLGLFWAVSHPSFMSHGDPIFLDFIHLKHSGVISHGGPTNDGKMSLAEGGGKGGFLGFGSDHLVAGPKMTVYLSNGTVLKDKAVPNANKALSILPKDLLPGVPLTLNTSYKQLELEGYENMLQRIEMQLVNNSTKEAEVITFKPEVGKNDLSVQLPTVAGKTVPHFDILVLVAIFALSMLASQKVMATPTTGNEQQQQLMKMMPIMFSVMMFIFPIPAGVLLYMDTNSIFQLVQTWWFNKSNPSTLTAVASPSQAVVDIPVAPTT